MTPGRQRRVPVLTRGTPPRFLLAVAVPPGGLPLRRKPGDEWRAGTYGTQPGGTAGEPSGSLRRAVALVDAVHRALLRACPVEHVHAGLPDNVGHPAFPRPWQDAR